MIITINGRAEDMEKLIEEDLPGLPIVTVVISWYETVTNKNWTELALRKVKEAGKRRGCVVDYLTAEDSERNSS